jgi:hypothetical protein
MWGETDHFNSMAEMKKAAASDRKASFLLEFDLASLDAYKRYVLNWSFLPYSENPQIVKVLW